MSEPTRRSVAVAGHLGDPVAARAGLRSADPGVRAAALGAIDRLGVATDGDITGSLADPDPLVRRRAATLAARHPGVDLEAALGGSRSLGGRGRRVGVRRAATASTT